MTIAPAAVLLPAELVVFKSRTAVPPAFDDGDTARRDTGVLGNPSPALATRVAKGRGYAPELPRRSRVPFGGDRGAGPAFQPVWHRATANPSRSSRMTDSSDPKARRPADVPHSADRTRLVRESGLRSAVAAAAEPAAVVAVVVAVAAAAGPSEPAVAVVLAPAVLLLGANTRSLPAVSAGSYIQTRPVHRL